MKMTMTMTMTMMAKGCTRKNMYDMTADNSTRRLIDVGTDLYKSRDQAKVQPCKCTMSARDHVIITGWSSGSSTQPGCWLPSSGND